MTTLRTKVHTTDTFWLPCFSLDVKEIKATVTKVKVEVEEIRTNTEEMFAAVTGRSAQPVVVTGRSHSYMDANIASGRYAGASCL